MIKADLLNAQLMNRLASIAYLVDADQVARAVEARGLDFVAQVGNTECQATVAQGQGRNLVIFRGTQFEQHTSIPEILNDLDPTPTKTHLGLVHGGAFDPMAELVEKEILPILGPGETWVGGHSLGATRAAQSPIVLPRVTRVYAYGMFKSAEHDVWNSLYGDGTIQLLSVLHARDFVHWWPEPNVYGWVQPPQPFWWLHDGIGEFVTSRPGISVSVGDHDVDAGYQAAIDKLVEAAG